MESKKDDKKAEGRLSLYKRKGLWGEVDIRVSSKGNGYEQNIIHIESTPPKQETRARV